MVHMINHGAPFPPAAEETFSEAAVAVAEEVVDFVEADVAEVVADVVVVVVGNPTEDMVEELSNAGWKS
ncbi:hypothetical protein VMCG_02382 [Cytospora schulzeri]|uniref:Uncharacterized protein n=1 Tax=Cytospora schulzeri TaxID=448051 RepID=A0A423X1J9_9PEZI|nr:hypothetical protein VMCG_02382 [Valsa malicola]